MFHSLSLTFLTSLLLTSSSATWTPHHPITAAHREKILHNYISIWDGDLSLIDSTLAPSLSLQIDRFPKGSHGSRDLEPFVTSATEFGGFVNNTRATLEDYKIVPVKWVGEGREIALRWMVQAVIPQNFTILPTTLQAGDTVTYNGTEYLTLNDDGLVEEVDSAQDLITFMWNLGNNINLTPRKHA